MNLSIQVHPKLTGVFRGEPRSCRQLVQSSCTVAFVSLPIHARVADELRGRIDRGELLPGTALPSEARLCEEFGASRGTIRSALAALRREGLIDGGQGRPPVVRATVASQPFENLMSFTAWAEQLGRKPGQRTIEVARRAVSPVAAHELGLAPGTIGVDILRIRLLDSEPVMIERATFVEPVGRLLFDFDPDSGSIYAHLTAKGIDLSSARHTFDAVAAGELDAEFLGIPVGAPLLRERRRGTAADGTPLEYGDDRYRPDRVTFTIDNSRPASNGLVRDLRILKETS
ncbi:MAG: GntR family transcriptional regulator [Actinobacteria bacterium]|nr:GntR family transcriptional regulator [Actinomycetota bacterium]